MTLGRSRRFDNNAFLHSLLELIRHNQSLRFHIRKPAPDSKATGLENSVNNSGLSASSPKNNCRCDKDEGDGQDNESYGLRIADQVSLLAVDVVLILTKESPRSI